MSKDASISPEENMVRGEAAWHMLELRQRSGTLLGRAVEDGAQHPLFPPLIGLAGHNR
jgi:hypothetical protein